MSTPPSALSPHSDAAARFAADVASSLSRTPRELPSQYLYDRLGSALFEAICRLPWYRIATIEQRLLETHGPAIHAHAGALTSVVELGPGSGEKLLTLVQARRVRELAVHLIDVSSEALEQATATLSTVPDLRVCTHQATYEAGLDALARDADSGPQLVAFLGSNIGNFDAAGARALLASIRAASRPGDALLLGTDLVKSAESLQLAYDDPLGVTAAFNRNLLVRINRELGGDFDLDRFAHRAVWNEPASRVEMHLVSLTRQRVRIPGAGLDLTFEPGDTIWTESSYKYRADELGPRLADVGYVLVDQWTDDSFALTLARAV